MKLLDARAYGEPMEHSGKLTLGTSPFIAGVCDGLANQLTVGVFSVRLVFILFSFFLGGGLLAYLLLYILMPRHESVGDIRRKELKKTTNSLL
ncbi:PspC domain-containing protein [Thalassotalea psychrophila]|uniref:PspC domain-containing protein n=1 Tax=Thalassotalea psychrophila TaxID=3065647 RepID=A0ABY9TVD8_9GAMM|nr:PspC domain-containing protein [Colwelliaceae bacterium SQ149]